MFDTYIVNLRPILTIYLAMILQPWVAGLLHVLTWFLDQYVFLCRWHALCKTTEWLFEVSLQQHIKNTSLPSHQEFSK